VLNGENPNNYGFNVDENYYQNMFAIIGQGSTSKGMNYFWWELSEKAKVATAPFIFNDAIAEKIQIKKIADRKVDEQIVNLNRKNETKRKRINFILRHKFSKLYSIYRNMR
jgi:hypothetical protein